MIVKMVQVFFILTRITNQLTQIFIVSTMVAFTWEETGENQLGDHMTKLGNTRTNQWIYRDGQVYWLNRAKLCSWIQAVLCSKDAVVCTRKLSDFNLPSSPGGNHFCETELIDIKRVHVLHFQNKFIPYTKKQINSWKGNYKKAIHVELEKNKYIISGYLVDMLFTQT